MARDTDQKYQDGPYANVHPILGHALRAARPEDRPAPPYHLSGPRPRCSGERLVHLALWCAELGRPYVEPDKLGDYDQMVALALSREQSAGLELARRSRGAFSLSGHALTAAFNRNRPDRMIQSVRSQAVKLVGLLAAAGEALAFLSELDRRLVQAECADALAEHAPTGVQLGEVLFRGDRGNGTAGHFVVRLANGNCGVITKLKGRWRWNEGDLDSVLATLPEPLFAEAVSLIQPKRAAQ